MSLMLKIAFALQLTVGAVALAGTNTNPAPSATVQDAAPTATNQDAATTSSEDDSPTPDRPTCDACADGYNECLSEGISADACRRAYANCFRNCL